MRSLPLPQAAALPPQLLPLLSLFVVPKSCLTLRPPWTAARLPSLSFTISRNLLKLMSVESVMPSNHLVLCRPLLLLPSGGGQHQGLSQHQGLFQ